MKRAEFEKLKTELNREGSLVCTVVTGSMEPLIKTGTEIHVVPLLDSPRRFDVIVFWMHDRLTCHYIWHLNALDAPDGQPLYITRGLHGPEDLPVPQDGILGIVDGVQIPRVTRIKLGIQAFRSLISKGFFS